MKNLSIILFTIILSACGGKKSSNSNESKLNGEAPQKEEIRDFIEEEPQNSQQQQQQQQLQQIQQLQQNQQQQQHQER